MPSSNAIKTVGIFLIIALFPISLYLNNSFLPFKLIVPLFESLLGDQPLLNNGTIFILLTTRSTNIHLPEQIKGNLTIQTEQVQALVADAFDCCQYLHAHNFQQNVVCFVVPEKWSTIDQWLLQVIKKVSHSPLSEWEFLISNADYLNYLNNDLIIVDQQSWQRVFLAASVVSVQQICQLFKTNDQRWKYLLGNHNLTLKHISYLLENDPESRVSYLLETSKHRMLKAEQVANTIRQKYFAPKGSEFEQNKGVDSKVRLKINMCQLFVTFISNSLLFPVVKLTTFAEGWEID